MMTRQHNCGSKSAQNASGWRASLATVLKERTAPGTTERSRAMRPATSALTCCMPVSLACANSASSWIR
jgi:hypothetical protein